MKYLPKSLAINLLVVTASIMLILLLPEKNIFTISLAIIVPVYIHKLTFEILNKQHPQIKSWLVSGLKILAWTAGIIIIFRIAGYFGYLYLILVILGIVAYKLYKGRKLFDKYTDWASDRVLGRTKKDFKFEEAIQDDKPRTENLREEEQRQDQSTAENSNSNLQESENSQETLQKVPDDSKKPRAARKVRQRKALHKMPKDLGD